MTNPMVHEASLYLENVTELKKTQCVEKGVHILRFCNYCISCKFPVMKIFPRKQFVSTINLVT